MDKMSRVSEASDMLGVDIRTLQRWDNEGKFKCIQNTWWAQKI